MSKNVILFIVLINIFQPDFYLFSVDLFYKTETRKIQVSR